MRGLKHQYNQLYKYGEESHLLQMRGLKPLISFTVWSQTSRIFYRCVDWNISRGCLQYFRHCRIFYRCVDWNMKADIIEFYRRVASFTDAWIETFCAAMARFWRLSHLLQMRGLKRPYQEKYQHNNRRIFYRCVDWNLSSNGALLASRSHLLQMRGLKHFSLDRKHHRHSRIFYRCVDWNFQSWIWPYRLSSHLLQMRGLKLSASTRNSGGTCRIFYRCVDWNA